MTQFDLTAHRPSRPSDAWLSPMSYWQPTLLVESAWHAHAPFAAWIMDVHRPRTLVELGTHNGFSYFTWCECAERLGIDTRFTAIDSWEGDEHAGFYSQSVYESVIRVNEKYAERSRLLRGYFAERAADVENDSIDLLHIDGRHGYEDVREDFELYAPKLSARGIVLFHDVTERDNGFGVYRFWEEARTEYPSFTFEHGHGLGVLFVGAEARAPFSDFLAAAEKNGDAIREDYERLGNLVEDRYLDQEGRREAAVLRAAYDKAVIELRQMRATKAWRVTAPARFFMSKVRSTRR